MQDTSNPLLCREGLPPYARITPDHIAPAVARILCRAREVLSEVTTADTVNWDTLMAPLEEIDLLFEYGWAPVGHLLGVANTEALRAAHETALPAIVGFSLEMRQHEGLYARMRMLKEGPDWPALAPAQRRIIDRALQTAELSGIRLGGEARARFNAIEQELSLLGTTFSNHLLDATKAWHLDLTAPAQAEGLPESLRRLAAAAWSQDPAHAGQPAATAETGPWRITLDMPSYGPFMDHCRDRGLREQVYRAVIARAASGSTDNTPLVERILTLRREMAQLLGYENFSAVSLAQKMAGDSAAVARLHERLLAVAHPVAQRELQDLTVYAQAHGHVGELRHWDIAFWAERQREEMFAFTDEELRPYFSLDRALAGLFSLCRQLFGIEISATAEPVTAWHPDVRFYEIFETSDSTPARHIASFFLDPYSRPQNKRGGAWMDTCIQRSAGSAGTRLPVAHLVCNGTPPTGEVPSLMTFREVETLFHEFGHGLQHMLTRIGYRDAAGISGIEWDAVELPSQFMENWCLHRATLMGMAVHYQTGETLPEALYRKLLAAKTYRAASAMLRQLQFGMTDMALHGDYVPGGAASAFDIERQIAARTSLLPPLPENRFLCSFSHIFAGGYAAGYYSYKWAEVLSADAFAAFEEAGLDDPTAVAQTGRRYRDTILAEGGARHPLEVFRAFRGRDPDPAPLLRHHGLAAA